MAVNVVAEKGVCWPLSAAQQMLLSDGGGGRDVVKTNALVCCSVGALLHGCTW